MRWNQYRLNNIWHTRYYSHPLEVWDAEEDLHYRTKVAAVSQIFDACITRAIHLLQLHARLLDHLPLADPRPGFIVCVVPVFCLKGKKGSYIKNTFWEKQSLHLALKAEFDWKVYYGFLIQPHMKNTWLDQKQRWRQSRQVNPNQSYTFCSCTKLQKLWDKVLLIVDCFDWNIPQNPRLMFFWDWYLLARSKYSVHQIY